VIDKLIQKKSILDVIIVGAGGAGCSAALEAWKETQNIVMLAKGSKFESKTANAQGGLQASIGPGDDPNQHFQDTMEAGNNKNNPKLVKFLTDRAADTVTWLESIGVSFDHDGDFYRLKSAAGLSRNRVLSCGDQTGNRIIKPVIRHVENSGIPILENAAVMKIKKSECDNLEK